MIRKLISSVAFAAIMMVSPLLNAQSIDVEQHIEVNINVADADELDKHLEGIGKKKAQAIVDHRAKYGKFESVESLKNVQGIGEVIVEKNRNRILL